MDNANVIMFPQRTPEAELPSLWAWARLAERYRFFPYQNGDDGPVGYTKGKLAFIMVTTGQPGNAARYQIDWTGRNWMLGEYDAGWILRRLRTFRSLRDALETICPTDGAAA